MDLLPITTPSTQIINAASGELAPIKYLPGYPRSIRFDAGRGEFNLNGDTVLSKKGQEFSFIPIGYRVFKDEILGLGRKRWAEFFFLNERYQVCSLLFHGYSVDNFVRLVATKMYYDEVNPCEVLLTAKPVERTSKHPEANQSKYFIADFTHQLLEVAELETLQHAVKGIQLWRGDTTTGDAELEFQLNWAPPIRQVDEELLAIEREADLVTA